MSKNKYVGNPSKLEKKLITKDKIESCFHFHLKRFEIYYWQTGATGKQNLNLKAVVYWVICE